MIGHAHHAAINREFATLLQRQPLISVHRGSGRGSIAENTVKAIRAAEVEGGDIVEIDVIASTDGDFYLFHDGYEPMAFGVEAAITSLSTAEIEALNYSWCIKEPGGYPVERLRTVLTECPDTFFNVDRSWQWWPRLLDELAEFGSPPHLLLKSPMGDDALAALAAHPVKFPYIPIVTTPEEVERAWNDTDINTVGVELIAEDRDHPFCDARYVESLRTRGMAILLNAMNLGNRIPLYAEMDDETSLFVDPDRGWGALLDRGADIIQTDWPGVLKRYLDQRNDR